MSVILAGQRAKRCYVKAPFTQLAHGSICSKDRGKSACTDLCHNDVSISEVLNPMK